MNRKEFLRTSICAFPLSVIGVNNLNKENKVNAVVDYWETSDSKKNTCKLKFNSNGKFKMVQFTDVHWKPENEASEIAAERMNEILDAEKPDFVIYTGDVAFGKPASKCYERAFEPVVKRNIPFAFTFGNHDDEQDMTRNEIFEFIKDIPGNMTGTVEGLSGKSNFIIPILSSDGKSNVFVIYGFDSLSYSPLKVAEGYDWIKQDQIDWYRQCSAEFTRKNAGRPVPAMAFFHIPLPEFNLASRSEGSCLIGIRKEEACAPKVNSGLFTTMLELGDIMAVFVGHDHVNDYVTSWKGILLGYGRYTGGKTVYCDVPWGNGGRVIELTEGKRSFESWIVTKNNRIDFRFTFPMDFSKETW